MEPPAPELKPDPQAKLKPWLGAGALVAGVALAAFLAWPGTAPSGDAGLSATEAAARQTAFNQFVDSGDSLDLPPVTAVEEEEAIAEMELPPDAEAVLKQDLQQERIKLVWITLWDDQANDGDVVSVRSDNFTRVVALTNTPERIALPAPSNGIVAVQGVRDGGGGITVAAKSGQITVMMPVMGVGGKPVGIPTNVPQ